ncbi:uncharacterized protein LOC115998659 [Ipomoea triloba]|uniref:uncharacterized protein LOC115998659 n=1 Tax=Ipomoea triloba TaxID=35885 RepID=UPI00125D5130|nr:uncharacterized protein LOC115998659 [Ipomoea triloba]
MVTKMAKGRKHTASWSERLLGSYSYGNGNGHERIAGGESELGEDDVWSTVDGMANDRSGEWSPRAGSESGGSFDGFRSRRHRQRVPRTEYHRLQDQDDGTSLTFDDLGETTPSGVVHQFLGQHDGVTAPANVRHLSTSVPVNIPNWSNFNRVNSVESFYDSDSVSYDRDFEMVPPHEYLAREYGRTGTIAANSMCEGAGRTLKGRDMSRVRDAVWSQTGFNG